jgi:hypothetical protein
VRVRMGRGGRYGSDIVDGVLVCRSRIEMRSQTWKMVNGCGQSTALIHKLRMMEITHGTGTGKPPTNDSLLIILR